MKDVAATRRLAASVVAFALGVGSFGAVHAQDASYGTLTGEIARCANGAETPAILVNVGVTGVNPALAKTDPNGNFSLALPPGQYTITAQADDGTTASRPMVPVQAGQTLDIGVLDLGVGIFGCGNDAGLPAVTTAPAATAAPTVAPTSVATVAPTAAPTVAPTPAPSATAVPANDSAPAGGSPGSPGSPGSASGG